MKKYILIIPSVFLVCYLILFFGSKKFQFIGSYLSHNQIVFIKKYIFPYKVINEIEVKLSEQKILLEDKKNEER